MRTLIEKTINAVPAFNYLVIASAEKPVTLQIDGDLGSNTIPVVGVGINGTDETNLYNDGESLEFSSTNPVITFYAPIRTRITKGATTNPVGLMEIRK